MNAAGTGNAARTGWKEMNAAGIRKKEVNAVKLKRLYDRQVMGSQGCGASSPYIQKGNY